ncbi:unnamed protein product [Urochloa humidicola]
MASFFHSNRHLSPRELLRPNPTHPACSAASSSRGRRQLRRPASSSHHHQLLQQRVGEACEGQRWCGLVAGGGAVVAALRGRLHRRLEGGVHLGGGAGALPRRGSLARPLLRQMFGGAHGG